MTTIVNTHDMNSVVGIGDSILFIKDGREEWRGNKTQVMSADNQALVDFIFASDLLRKAREAAR